MSAQLRLNYTLVWFSLRQLPASDSLVLMESEMKVLTSCSQVAHSVGPLTIGGGPSYNPGQNVEAAAGGAHNLPVG